MKWQKKNLRWKLKTLTLIVSVCTFSLFARAYTVAIYVNCKNRNAMTMRQFYSIQFNERSEGIMWPTNDGKKWFMKWKTICICCLMTLIAWAKIIFQMHLLVATVRSNESVEFRNSSISKCCFSLLFLRNRYFTFIATTFCQYQNLGVIEFDLYLDFQLEKKNQQQLNSLFTSSRICKIEAAYILRV